MRAVSAKVWNGWKATLLRELYARVAEVLAGRPRRHRARRARRAPPRTRRLELLADWPQADRDRFAALGYAGYWLVSSRRRMPATPG